MKKLIAVKENSLLLMESGSGADVSFDVRDIEVITIKKKSYTGTGALVGLLVGSGIAVGIAADWDAPAEGYMRGIALFGGVGALIGAGMGAVIKREEIIQIKGGSCSEIKEALEKLRKKARIPDYQ